MQVNLDKITATYRIHGYDDGEITVAYPNIITADEQHDAPPLQHETLRTSLVIAPNELIRDWPPTCCAELQADHFAMMIRLEPEIVLFGSGRTLNWPEPALLAPLIEHGIGVEVMDSGAACRTYNILMADDRQVVAAILIDQVRSPRPV